MSAGLTLDYSRATDWDVDHQRYHGPSQKQNEVAANVKTASVNKGVSVSSAPANFHGERIGASTRERLSFFFRSRQSHRPATAHNASSIMKVGSIRRLAVIEIGLKPSCPAESSVSAIEFQMNNSEAKPRNAHGNQSMSRSERFSWLLATRIAWPAVAVRAAPTTQSVAPISTPSPRCNQLDAIGAPAMSGEISINPPR